MKLQGVVIQNTATLQSKFSPVTIPVSTVIASGRNSSVDTATRYGLDGPGVESRWGRRPDRSWGPSSLLYNGYRVSPGGKAAGAWC